ncbi:MAG: sensor histidine kinase [Oscillospiraceae bacterium]|nr:sensor histidine kinase [Oscillospiraceae bacterium]
MRFFGSFLYSRRRIIVVFLLVEIVFTLFMLLYGVQISAVAYSVLISAAIVGAAAFGDFWRFRKKCGLLSELQNEVLYTLEHLPEPDSESENGYRQLAETLFLEKNALVSAADKRYADASEYFAMWAHQIKTPITAMSLALQSCDFPEKDELAEYLQRIEQYVEMALCYVHLDNDESDLVIKSHPLDEIVKQAVRKFSKQFIRRKVTLVYEPLEIDVLTDEKLLLFVIEQLISNALKYTKHGSVEIALETPREPVLLIRDTGIGIAAEDLPRVFERGFTGINGRSDKRATGIGLYLCKRICERLGHEISASSGENGTEIRIDLRSSQIDTRE